MAAAGPIPDGTLSIHADRGSAMRSRTVAELLSDLRIGRTHSRPHVSNDCEAGFKTLKYAPDFPGRFGSIGDARAFVGPYLDFYNHHHRHSGIGYHTPASVHFGTAGLVRAERALVLDAAYATHPERFVNKPPTRPSCRARPGATSPRRSKDRASRDDVSHRT